MTVAKNIIITPQQRFAQQQADRSQKLKQTVLKPNPPKETEKEPVPEPKAAKETPVPNESKRTEQRILATTPPANNRSYYSSRDFEYGSIDINKLSSDRIGELLEILKPIEVDVRTKHGEKRQFEISYFDDNYYRIADKADTQHGIAFTVSEQDNNLVLNFNAYEIVALNPREMSNRSFLERLFLEKEIIIAKNGEDFTRINKLLETAKKRALLQF